jgi:hypothetical protein
MGGSRSRRWACWRYAYGNTECAIHYEAGEPRKRDRRKPRDQWLALVPNAHEGCVDRDDFERIQNSISGNLRPAGHAGASKNGEALAAPALREQADATHYTGIGHGPATTAPHGSLHPFGLGQILSPYATRYRLPVACSAFSYLLPQQIPLRVTCLVSMP